MGKTHVKDSLFKHISNSSIHSNYFFTIKFNYTSQSDNLGFYLCRCSVAQWCLALCNPVDCSTPGFPVLHYLLEFAQSHVHRVDDAIPPSHPLSPPSPPALSLSQPQGLFQWVGSLHQVARVLELQLQHLSFQWIYYTREEKSASLWQLTSSTWKCPISFIFHWPDFSILVICCCIKPPTWFSDWKHSHIWFSSWISSLAMVVQPCSLWLPRPEADFLQHVLASVGQEGALLTWAGL